MPPTPAGSDIILHVDGNHEAGSRIEDLFASLPYAVRRARSLEAGLHALAQCTFSCVLVGNALPDASDLQAVASLRRSAPSVPLVVLGGEGGDDAAEAVRLGAQEWLTTSTIDARALSAAITLAIARQEAQARLLWRASHDELTGLPTRAFAIEHLVRAIGRAARGDAQLAVLFCDLDGFKELNDRLGHAAGDAMLVTVAARLLAALRPGDVVARWGGDEFLVIVDEIESPDHAVAVAQRLRQAVAEPLGGERHQRRISATLGVAIASGPADSAELIAQADLAMLEAKRSATGLRLAA